MRLVILAALLAGCGLGFDDEPSPETPADCERAGGKVRRDAQGFVCDFPGGQNGAAAVALAVPGDAGARD